MVMSGLSAHTGKTFRCTREELRTAPLPEATNTWRPVPHFDLATMIVDNANRRGYAVKEEGYAMSKDLLGVFGAITFAPRDNVDTESTRMVGFRHDNKKNMALRLSAGKVVFVCDNMCFSGEQIIAFKHSGQRDYGAVVGGLFHGLDAKFANMDRTIDFLKDTELSQVEARNKIIDACAAGAFASCDIMPVLEEYAESSAGFKPGNVWSLYNAITWVAKKFPPPKFDNCLRTIANLFMRDSTETVETYATSPNLLANPA